MRKQTAAVIGGGSWGTALATVLAQNGPVKLWARDSHVVDTINKEHRNPKYQSDFLLSEQITACHTLKGCIQGCDLVCLVVPSHAMRTTLEELRPHIEPNMLFVSASKGIENGTLKTMHGVLKDCLPESLHKNFGFLSGPSFARETIQKMATAVTVASECLETAEKIQERFSTPYFRVYATEDVIGVELGGANKNVIAIASGLVDGLKLGHNTRAALITRGLAEVTRLATSLGGHPLTLSGLAGMGDLVLTCSGDLSRNRHVGVELAKGKNIDEIVRDMKQVAEGIRTTKSVYHLGLKSGVELPISCEIYRILYEGKNPRDALRDLMQRTLRHERE